MLWVWYCIKTSAKIRSVGLGRPRRPALRVGPACPGEEIGEIVEFVLAEVELRHLAAALSARRLRLHPILDGLMRRGRILVAAPAFEHVADFRSETRSFAIDRVAVETGVALPDALAPFDGRREMGLVRALGQDVMAAVRR